MADIEKHPACQIRKAIVRCGRRCQTNAALARSRRAEKAAIVWLPFA